MFGLGAVVDFSKLKNMPEAKYLDLYNDSKASYDLEQEETRKEEARIEKEHQKRLEREQREREEKEELERKLKEKEDSEKRLQQEQERERQYELNKSESDKMDDLRSDICGIFDKYDDAFRSDENVEKYNKVCNALDSALNQITDVNKF